MKAKDTAMNKKQVDELLDKIRYGERIKSGALFAYEHEINRLFREAQAEISFKAGLREVADWLHSNLSDLEPTTTYMHIDPIEWKAKLREWGIGK